MSILEEYYLSVMDENVLYILTKEEYIEYWEAIQESNIYSITIIDATLIKEINR